MGNVKIKLNYKAVGQMLKSHEMKDVLAEQAKIIADRVGGEFVINTAPTRVIARVKGDDGRNGLVKAMKKNGRENNSKFFKGKRR